MSNVDVARTRLEQFLAPELVDAIEELAEARARAIVAERDDQTTSKTWLTLKEAGEQLGCSPDAVRMRIRRGRLESEKQGRCVYVSAASVERLAA